MAGGLATVIGGRGFVGARLATRLRTAGWDVHLPLRGDTDLTSRELGTAFYCAGLTADYDARPFDTVEAHASLFSRLVRDGRFERIVYLSSTRLYDGMAKAEVDEAEPLSFQVTDPRQVYDLSKALGENLALMRGQGRGRVARLANVFDWEERSPGFLSQWLQRARTGKTIALDSSPHIARDYIHVDDVADALIAIADAPEPVIVNVASGELVSNAQIGEVFTEAGWTIHFNGDANPPSPPSARIDRLKALGVTPRPVKDVVRGYLESLA